MYKISCLPLVYKQLNAVKQCHEAELALRCRPSVGSFKKEEEAVLFVSISFVYLSQLPDAIKPTANVVVIGSAALDITAQADANTSPSQAMHSTAPGTVSMSLGGVARNIAEASHRIMEARYSDLSSLLIAPVGNDHFGDAIVQEISKLRMRTDGLVKTDKRSAVCNMVLNSGGALVGGVADMDITRTFSGDMVAHHHFLSPSVINVSNLADAVLSSKAYAQRCRS